MKQSKKTKTYKDIVFRQLTPKNNLTQSEINDLNKEVLRLSQVMDECNDSDTYLLSYCEERLDKIIAYLKHGLAIQKYKGLTLIRGGKS